MTNVLLEDQGNSELFQLGNREFVGFEGGRASFYWIENGDDRQYLATKNEDTGDVWPSLDDLHAATSKVSGGYILPIAIMVISLILMFQLVNQGFPLWFDVAGFAFIISIPWTIIAIFRSFRNRQRAAAELCAEVRQLANSET